MTPFRLCIRNLLLAFFVILTGPALADDTMPAKESSALGVRQQRVKRMMQDLDRKFQDLAQKLQETEPDQAKLLIKAFQQSRERLIEQRMDEIARLLDASKLSDADSKQNEVQIDLDALLRVLLDQSKDWNKVNAEVERLEETRKAVQQLLEKQRELLHETDRIANKDRTLADLDEQIRKLDELIEKQSKLNDETSDSNSNETPELNELAAKQDQLQQETANLAKSVGSPTGSQQCKACLGNASQSQKSASQKLAKALANEAKKDELKALHELEKAKSALKNEQDRIARLPKEVLDQLAQKQQSTSDEAEKLVDAMSEMPESQTENGTKGQKNVEQAQQEMRQAADGLRQSDADAATKKQEKAVDELKQALDQIEKRLAQLREETLIDRLTKLEARFRSMLTKQKEVTQSTVAVQSSVTNVGKLTRADLINLRKLASEEHELAEEAHQTMDILVEDGTSVVFTTVVATLERDLGRLADMLTNNRFDEFVQSLQSDVEVTLQELIDALQRNLKKKKSEGGGKCDCEPPLVPGSAELKLLRSMQSRVFDRTKLLDKMLGGSEPDAVMKNEVSALAEMQKKVSEMTLQLSEKY